MLYLDAFIAVKSGSITAQEKEMRTTNGDGLSSLTDKLAFEWRKKWMICRGIKRWKTNRYNRRGALKSGLCINNMRCRLWLLKLPCGWINPNPTKRGGRVAIKQTTILLRSEIFRAIHSQDIHKDRVRRSRGQLRYGWQAHSLVVSASLNFHVFTTHCTLKVRGQCARLNSKAWERQCKQRES